MQFPRHLLLALVVSLLLPSLALAASGSVKNGFVKRNAWLLHGYNFRIEYSQLMAEQSDQDGDGIPDVVETIAEAAIESWDVQVDDLNYPDPMANSDARLMIILDENDQYLSPGALGVTGILSNGDPYIALDPYLSDDYLKITTAHELFHAIQFGYGWDFAYSDSGINWAEATATWMEDNVYDDINDHVNYLGDYFSYVDYSVFASAIPENSLFQYGLNIWPRFLSEYYNDDVIQDIWEEYFDSHLSETNPIRVHQSVEEIVEDEGDDLPSIYQEFALWNLDLDRYEEGNLYPEVFVLEGEEGGYVLSNENYAPALYGSNYLYFENTDNEEEFYLHLVKPEGVRFTLTLVAMDNGEPDTSKIYSEVIDWNDEMVDYGVVESLRGEDGVMAIISAIDLASMNFTDVFDEGYLYAYSAEFVNEASELTSEPDVSEDLGDGDTDKDGQSPSSEENFILDEYVLSILNYDEDSATLSWNRLPDEEDVVGYQLHYGTDSGDHDFVIEIDQAYTTATSVRDLEEGEMYYFQLIAVDEDGRAEGDPSEEISVMPAEWLFTDLSHLDDHVDAISALVDWGIFSGYPDGSFRSNATINRAELLKILVEARVGEPDSIQYRNCFPDVAADWYAKYVCYAQVQGWVQGYPDGRFRPEQTVNKVEALKMLFNVYDSGLVEGTSVTNSTYPDVSNDAWFSVYVDEASELGILEEVPDADFVPAEGRNRGDMAEELYRYLVILMERAL